MKRQLEAWEAVRSGAPDRLFTLEHDPVVTLGRRARESDLLVPREVLESRGIAVEVADRGGEVTYHGPGQLVVYAIVQVERARVGPGDLVRRLAGALEQVLESRGIAARYDKDHPGLWTPRGKLVAVGMRVTGGASLHGAALNLTTPLDVFSLFVPCGMPGAMATSVEAELGVAPDLEACAGEVASAFASRMARRLVVEERSDGAPHL